MRKWLAGVKDEASFALAILVMVPILMLYLVLLIKEFVWLGEHVLGLGKF